MYLCGKVALRLRIFHQYLCRVVNGYILLYNEYMTRSRLPDNKLKTSPIVHKIKKLKPQKMHLDYIAGLLSIPLLVMGLIVNFSNISKKPATTTASPTPQVIVVPEKDTSGNTSRPVVIPTNTAACQKTIGPISITSPEEGDTVTDNPVCITISYPNTNYCSVVWSYRINNGAWSDYNNNSPCLYNIPSGNVQFQLRVTSTVSTDTKSITRNFTYKGGGTTTTPSASSSAQ